jgi:hypothetical protein
MSFVSDFTTMFSAPYASNNSTLPAVSFFCWVKYSSSTGSQNLLSLSNTAAFTFGLIKANTNNVQSISYNDNTAANSRNAVETGFNPILNTWTPICGTSPSVSTVTFMTTRETTTNTSTVGNIVTASWNQVQFNGRLEDSVAASSWMPVGSMLAELAIWNVGLSTLESQNLVFGHWPPWRIRPSALLCYMPLRSNVFDYGPGGLAFTPTSATASTYSFSGDHPILAAPQPIRRTWVFMPGLTPPLPAYLYRPQIQIWS